jgi:YD repeat-containing protein
MKRLAILFGLGVSIAAFAQNHTEKPIRFIFESIHDHLGNLDVNSKRVKLFDREHRLLYEADLYEATELDEQFFYYDKEGRLLRDHRIFHKPHESGDYRMEYDAKGNLVKETNMNDLDEVIEIKEMTYDGRGNMLTQEVSFFHHLDNKMIMESSFSFKYDDKGNLIEKTGWEGEKPNEKVTYKYAISPTEMSTKRYNSRGDITEKWVDNYDSEGKLIKEIHARYSNGRMKQVTIDLEYDEHGHILKETMTRSGSSIQKTIDFEYVYDEYGNWIERKETKKMGAKVTPGVHLKRHIEYYEDTDYNHPPMEMDESFIFETHEGEEFKVFQETHVRINNNNGDLEWVVRRNGPDLFQVDEYEYHKDGKLDKVFHLTHEHKDHAYSEMTYNDKGQLEKETSHSHTGSKEEETVYEYNAQGQIIKKTEHWGTKEILVETFEYDKEGRLTQEVEIEEGEKITITYTYDANGKLVKEVMDPDAKGEEVSRVEYVYEGDKLIKILEFEGKKSTTPTDETCLTYDERGEVIKTADYRGGKIHAEVDYVYFD